MAQRPSSTGGLARRLRRRGAGLRGNAASELAGSALALRDGALLGHAGLGLAWERQLDRDDLAGLNLQGERAPLEELGASAEHFVAPALHRSHVRVLLDGDAFE